MSIYLRSVKPVEKDRNSRVVKLSISGIGATDGIQLHVLRQRPIPPIKFTDCQFLQRPVLFVDFKV